MNKLVATLSLTTIAFGISTAYLAYRLYGQAAAVTTAVESNPDPVAATHALTGGALGNGAPAASAPIAAAGSAAPASSAAGSAATTKPDAVREEMLHHARRFLARFDDATQHAVLIEETKTALRRQYEPFRSRLKLDKATFEQFLAVLAEQTLQPQEKYFRCIADPDCDLATFGRNGDVVDDRSAELTALLGPENMEKFQRYQNTLGERDTVIQLRGRLDDANNLRDSQAEQLVAALSDERARYQREAPQRGATISGWGTGQLGMLFYPSDGNSIEQRFVDAAQYSRRMRDRAATILAPQQLAAFEQMQSELLAAMKAAMSPPS